MKAEWAKNLIGLKALPGDESLATMYQQGRTSYLPAIIQSSYIALKAAGDEFTRLYVTVMEVMAIFGCEVEQLSASDAGKVIDGLKLIQSERVHPGLMSSYLAAAVGRGAKPKAEPSRATVTTSPKRAMFEARIKAAKEDFEPPQKLSPAERLRRERVDRMCAEELSDQYETFEDYQRAL